MNKRWGRRHLSCVRRLRQKNLHRHVQACPVYVADKESYVHYNKGAKIVSKFSLLVNYSEASLRRYAWLMANIHVTLRYTNITWNNYYQLNEKIYKNCTYLHFISVTSNNPEKFMKTYVSMLELTNIIP